METDGNLMLYVLLLVSLILVNAFFAMSEIAVISLNDNKVKRLAGEGDKKAATLVKMMEEPSRFLATIQVGVTLSGFLASAVAADTFAKYVVYAFTGLNVSPAIVRGISLVVITLVLSYFTLVFGELVPKRLAMQHSEPISFAIVRPLSLVYKLERPFVALLSNSTNAILRLLGIDPAHKSAKVTEEEIRMMIDVGNEAGSIEEGDMDMINNIFEFDDRTAIEMMSHRTEMTVIYLDTPLQEIIRVATSTGYSRIPVCDEEIDSVQGILYVKDLLPLVMSCDQSRFNIQDYLREALFVLESTNCKTLFQEFKLKKIQMAIVVDEYGGTSGLITMEDLLESIVGNIQDEYDNEEEDISAVSENVFIIDGLAPLEDVQKFLDLKMEDEDGGFETIGGYILSQIGHIPDEDETPSIQVGDICFTITKMDERRISKLKAERLQA